MIDATLQELWAIKDNIAKEHAYDLENLVDYLNGKYQSSIDKVEALTIPIVESEPENSNKLKSSQGHMAQ